MSIEVRFKFYFGNARVKHHTPVGKEAVQCVCASCVDMEMMHKILGLNPTSDMTEIKRKSGNWILFRMGM